MKSTISLCLTFQNEINHFDSNTDIATENWPELWSFAKGNPFGAYQIVNKCNDLCKTKEDSSTPIGQRFFALEVIGKLYLELGRLLGSCFPDTVFSLLKSLKLSESSRVECLNALTNLIIGLEASAAMKHQEIYKNVRPYLANSDADVRSAAALCVAQLCSKYSALVSTTEVEYLFQIRIVSFYFFITLSK